MLHMKNKLQLKSLMKPALIFFTLLIILLNYQLVYKKNVKEIKAINGEMSALSQTLSELRAKEADRDALIKENDIMTGQINEKIMAFGSGATEEKSILFIHELEKNTGMDIDTVTFSEPEYFLNEAENSYTADNSGETAADAEALSDTNALSDPNALSDSGGTADTDVLSDTGGTADTENPDFGQADTADGLPEVGSTGNGQGENQNITGGITGNGATKTIDLGKVKGYKSTLNITFKVSYEGLKKCIDYINNYPEKRNINEITLSYDSETGNLTGSMKINMYDLTGAGREYTEPAAGNAGIGLENPFGTIDVKPD